MDDFKSAKELLDTRIRNVISEFQRAVPEAKVLGLDVRMTGWQSGSLDDLEDTVDMVRITIDV